MPRSHMKSWEWWHIPVNPPPRRQRQVNPWGSLANQLSLTSKLHVNRDSVSKVGGWHSRLNSNLCKHAYMHTQAHTQSICMCMSTINTQSSKHFKRVDSTISLLDTATQTPKAQRVTLAKWPSTKSQGRLILYKTLLLWMLDLNTGVLGPPELETSLPQG